MDYRQLYEKYRSRMSKEGMLKAFLCALAVGFAVAGVIALITWIVGFDAGLWLALGAWAFVTAAATPAFYNYLFQPTEQAVARRLDSLGLEERVVTMQELQNDTSDIARLQRADAANTVAAAAGNAAQGGGKLIKYKLSKATVAAVVGLGVFGTAMTVVTGLSGFGVIGSGKAVWGEMFTNDNNYSVVYSGADCADFTGNDKQTVKEGGSSSEVLFTAHDYYYFIKWKDNLGNEYGNDKYGPSRYEENVRDNLKFDVFFDKVDEISDDEDWGREFLPSGNQDWWPGGGGGSSDPGDIDYELNRYDYIIDNNTKYNVDYQKYYEAAMEYLANNENLSPEERAMIENYFNILL